MEFASQIFNGRHFELLLLLFFQLQEMLCLGCSNPTKVMLAFQSYMHLCEGKLIYLSYVGYIIVLFHRPFQGDVLFSVLAGPIYIDSSFHWIIITA